MQPRTESMKTIVGVMRDFRLGSLEQSLDEVVQDEETALRRMAASVRAAELKELRIDAELGVAALILKWLKAPEAALEPRHVLHYRCEAAAWAIARTLEDAVSAATLAALMLVLKKTP